jgi:hypothetical protein
LALYTAGQRVRASELNRLPQTYFVESDQTVNNSTTLVNIPGLSFAADVNAKYLAECFIVYQTNDTADFKLAWTGPASFSGWFSMTGVVLGSAGGNPGDLDAGVTLTITDSVARCGDGTQPLMVTVQSYIAIAGTAGTVQLKFAQNTINASNTIISTGSMMRVTKLSS